MVRGKQQQQQQQQQIKKKKKKKNMESLSSEVTLIKVSLPLVGKDKNKNKTIVPLGRKFLPL